MGVTWAIAWAAGGIGLAALNAIVPGGPLESFFRIFDAPAPALGLPGFIAGTFFSLVLGIAGRNRRFDELSLTRFTLWGAAGGLMLSLLPIAMVGADLATPAAGLNLVKVTLVIALPFTLFSAVSAATMLILARRGERPAHDAAAALGLGEARSIELDETERLRQRK